MLSARVGAASSPRNGTASSSRRGRAARRMTLSILIARRYMNAGRARKRRRQRSARLILPASVLLDEEMRARMSALTGWRRPAMGRGDRTLDRSARGLCEIAPDARRWGDRPASSRGASVANPIRTGPSKKQPSMGRSSWLESDMAGIVLRCVRAVGAHLSWRTLKGCLPHPRTVAIGDVEGPHECREPSPSSAVDATRFQPAGRGEPAPTTVPDARAAFGMSSETRADTEVADPQRPRTAEARSEEQTLLRQLVRAQREGEELSGFASRQ